MLGFLNRLSKDVVSCILAGYHQIQVYSKKGYVLEVGDSGVYIFEGYKVCISGGDPF